MSKEFKGRYYFVSSIDLARAIVFITGEHYYILDDREDKTKKIYSFKNSRKLQEVIEIIIKLQEEFKSENCRDLVNP